MRHVTFFVLMGIFVFTNCSGNDGRAKGLPGLGGAAGRLVGNEHQDGRSRSEGADEVSDGDVQGQSNDGPAVDGENVAGPTGGDSSQKSSPVSTFHHIASGVAPTSIAGVKDPPPERKAVSIYRKMIDPSGKVRPTSKGPVPECYLIARPEKGDSTTTGEFWIHCLNIDQVILHTKYDDPALERLAYALTLDARHSGDNPVDLSQLLVSEPRMSADAGTATIKWKLLLPAGVEGTASIRLGEGTLQMTRDGTVTGQEVFTTPIGVAQ